MQKTIFTFLVSICILTSVNAQIFYVDSQVENDINKVIVIQWEH